MNLDLAKSQTRPQKTHSSRASTQRTSPEGKLDLKKSSFEQKIISREIYLTSKKLSSGELNIINQSGPGSKSLRNNLKKPFMQQIKSKMPHPFKEMRNKKSPAAIQDIRSRDARETVDSKENKCESNENTSINEMMVQIEEAQEGNQIISQRTRGASEGEMNLNCEILASEQRKHKTVGSGFGLKNLGFVGEKDPSASPSKKRNMEMLFGSTADRNRHKYFSDKGKKSGGKCNFQLINPYVESLKPSKRSIEKMVESPPKKVKEDLSKKGAIELGSATDLRFSPPKHGKMIMQKVEAVRDVKNKEVYPKPVERKNKYSTSSRYFNPGNIVISDEKTADIKKEDKPKQRFGFLEKKQLTGEQPKSRRSSSNIKSTATISKRDLEISVSKAQKELSKPIGNTILHKKKSVQKNNFIKSKTTSRLSSNQALPDFLVCKITEETNSKKKLVSEKIKENPRTRLIHDLGFLEQNKETNGNTGVSTADSLKKPIGKKPTQKVKEKRKELVTESDQYKRDISLNFKALMDKNVLQKHVMAIKASSENKILSIIQKISRISPDLYYLSRLFESCKYSLEMRQSQEETQDPEKLIAIENYSQNVLGFSKTTEQRLKSLSEYIPKRFELSEYQTSKRTLLFDLDETLAHCTNPTISLFSSESSKANVMVRPRVFEVISELRTHFEIGIFTSATKEYADFIIKLFDPQNKLFDFRLYRNSCVDIGKGLVLKDLRVMKDRDIQSVFIVDNNTFCFGFQLNQGIPILPFTGDEKDREMDHLLKYLLLLSRVPEPSKFNSRYFGHDLLLQHCENVSVLPMLMIERIAEISDLVKVKYSCT